MGSKVFLGYVLFDHVSLCSGIKTTCSYKADSVCLHSYIGMLNFYSVCLMYQFLFLTPSSLRGVNFFHET